jgi:hypothetical protein
MLLRAVRPGLPLGLTSYSGRELDYILLYASEHLPSFLGAGAAIGVAVAQV